MHSAAIWEPTPDNPPLTLSLRSLGAERVGERWGTTSPQQIGCASPPRPLKSTSKFYAQRDNCARATSAGAENLACARHLSGRTTMLDVLYLLIGAAFLGVCAAYALACEHL